jgi:DNA-binding beta-propeller fold protein YncE
MESVRRKSPGFTNDGGFPPGIALGRAATPLTATSPGLMPGDSRRSFHKHCWLVITPNSKYAYVSNTASGSISEFAIGVDGSLSLVASIAASTQGPPLDMAITGDGLYLDTLTASGNIEVFRIDAATGGLAQAQVVTGLPAGSNGLASF